MIEKKQLVALDNSCALEAAAMLQHCKDVQSTTSVGDKFWTQTQCAIAAMRAIRKVADEEGVELPDSSSPFHARLLRLLFVGSNCSAIGNQLRGKAPGKAAAIANMADYA